MFETIKLEEGKVTMSGVPFTFTLMKSVYYTYKELEKALGKDWEKLIYECSKVESREAFQGYLRIFRNNPQAQKLIFIFRRPVIKFFIYQYNRLGVGRLELVSGDHSKPLYIFRMYFSPTALAYLEHEKSKKPVCTDFAGTLAGPGELVYPGIEVIETKCLAKGDPYCEFVLSLPKK